MPAEKRTEEDIRREIAGEREELVSAIADLRAGVAAKRKSATVVGGAVATGLAALLASRIVRRRR